MRFFNQHGLDCQFGSGRGAIAQMAVTMTRLAKINVRVFNEFNEMQTRSSMQTRPRCLRLEIPHEPKYAVKNNAKDHPSRYAVLKRVSSKRRANDTIVSEFGVKHLGISATDQNDLWLETSLLLITSEDAQQTKARRIAQASSPSQIKKRLPQL